MSDTPRKSPRLQHVVLHIKDDPTAFSHSYSDVRVFGTELEALRYMVEQSDVDYVAVPHGLSVAEAIANRDGVL